MKGGRLPPNNILLFKIFCIALLFTKIKRRGVYFFIFYFIFLIVNILFIL